VAGGGGFGTPFPTRPASRVRTLVIATSAVHGRALHADRLQSLLDRVQRVGRQLAERARHGASARADDRLRYGAGGRGGRRGRLTRLRPWRLQPRDSLRERHHARVVAPELGTRGRAGGGGGRPAGGGGGARRPPPPPPPPPPPRPRHAAHRDSNLGADGEQSGRQAAEQHPGTMQTRLTGHQAPRAVVLLSQRNAGGRRSGRAAAVAMQCVRTCTSGSKWAVAGEPTTPSPPPPPPSARQDAPAASLAPRTACEPSQTGRLPLLPQPRPRRPRTTTPPSATRREQRGCSPSRHRRCRR
jgi:hypothetical protein